MSELPAGERPKPSIDSTFISQVRMLYDGDGTEQSLARGAALADRSLSRLLGKDFPRSLEELELRKASAKAVLENRADKVEVPKPTRRTKREPKSV